LKPPNFRNPIPSPTNNLSRDATFIERIKKTIDLDSLGLLNVQHKQHSKLIGILKKYGDYPVTQEVFSEYAY